MFQNNDDNQEQKTRYSKGKEGYEGESALGPVMRVMLLKGFEDRCFED